MCCLHCYQFLFHMLKTIGQKAGREKGKKEEAKDGDWELGMHQGWGLGVGGTCSVFWSYTALCEPPNHLEPLFILLDRASPHLLLFNNLCLCWKVELLLSIARTLSICQVLCFYFSRSCLAFILLCWSSVAFPQPLCLPSPLLRNPSSFGEVLRYILDPLHLVFLDDKVLETGKIFGILA